VFQAENMTVPRLATIADDLVCNVVDGAVCDTLPIVSAGSISSYTVSTLASLREVTRDLVVYEDVVHCPELQSVGGSLVINTHTLAHHYVQPIVLSFPKLRTVGNDFAVKIGRTLGPEVGNLSMSVPSFRTINRGAILSNNVHRPTTAMLPTLFLDALRGITSLGYVQVTGMTDQWLLCKSTQDYFASISSSASSYAQAVVMECE
jgi:hypothetical protein